jgi:hypothetical protein
VVDGWRPLIPTSELQYVIRCHLDSEVSPLYQSWGKRSLSTLHWVDGGYSFSVKVASLPAHSSSPQRSLLGHAWRCHREICASGLPAAFPSLRHIRSIWSWSDRLRVSSVCPFKPIFKPSPTTNVLLGDVALGIGLEPFGTLTYNSKSSDLYKYVVTTCIN